MSRNKKIICIGFIINFVSYLAIIILYALFSNDIDKLQMSVLYSFISVVSYFALHLLFFIGKKLKFKIIFFQIFLLFVGLFWTISNIPFVISDMHHILSLLFLIPCFITSVSWFFIEKSGYKK